MKSYGKIRRGSKSGTRYVTAHYVTVGQRQYHITSQRPWVELHVDHIMPWAKGGEIVLENLQTLCSKCNLGKSDMV